jgi:AraC-like DNA-binding protein
MPPIPPDDISSNAATLKIVQAYHLAWKSRDVAAILSMFHQDIQYHDYSLNQIFDSATLPAYIESNIPKSKNDMLIHSDRIRVDGHTAFIQYELVMQGASFRASEAITVADGKIIRINEYGVLVSNQPSNPVQPKPTVQNKLGLSARQLAILSQDLQQYFSETKPFLNSEVSLQSVADATGYTRNQISYLLNTIFGQTFYQYVHDARINHLLTIIDSLNPLPPLDQLAFSSGFNSLSVFYKHFKRHTGLSPKAYIKSHKL